MRKFISTLWSTIMSSMNKVKADALAPAKSSDVTEKLAKKRTLRYAVFLSYQGKSYFGMQVCFYSFPIISFEFKVQKDYPTIEGHLLTALRLYGIIDEEQEQKPFGFYFQRAARTDRAVSAVRQVKF